MNETIVVGFDWPGFRESEGAIVLAIWRVEVDWFECERTTAFGEPEVPLEKGMIAGVCMASRGESGW